MTTATAIPDFGVTLRDEDHTYWTRSGRQLASVGSLVKRVAAPFDQLKVAERVAQRDGRKASEVLAEWAEKRDRACATGKALHDLIDRHLGGEDISDLTNMPSVAHHWLQWWKTASLSLRPVRTEYIVACEDLGYAGTMDFLADSARTNQAHVLDWKQNKDFNTVSRYGDRMRRPFDDLEDCELTHYSLQVSLYALALERAGVEVGSCWIVWLSDHFGARPFRALDLRRRAERWVKGLKL